MSRRRSTGFSPEVTQLVLARSEGYCECMAKGCLLIATERHHRRPRGMGSTLRPETNTASACLHLCRRCHLQIESMRNWALSNGFLVGQRDDPAAIPVWWRCNETSVGHKVMVLLDNSGNIIGAGRGEVEMTEGVGRS